MYRALPRIAHPAAALAAMRCVVPLAVTGSAVLRFRQDEVLAVSTFGHVLLFRIRTFTLLAWTALPGTELIGDISFLVKRIVSSSFV